MDRFKFIGKYKELYNLCTECEKYAQSDPSSSLLKARQVLEQIVTYINENKKIQTSLAILTIRKNKKIDKYNSKVMRKLNIICNKGIHNPETAPRYSKEGLKLVTHVCYWFVYIYEKNHIDISLLPEDDYPFLISCFSSQDEKKRIMNLIKQKDELKKYKLQAEKGNIDAQIKLAECYYKGKGISRNYELAIEYYEKAAEQGSLTAQKKLSLYYYQGKITPKNYEKAVLWFEKAALQGDVVSQFHLANCYYDGLGIRRSRKKATEWYTKAAEQEDAASQFRLANCYYEGKGVSKSKKRAIIWLTKAAENGNVEARKQLDIIAPKKYAIQKTTAKENSSNTLTSCTHVKIDKISRNRKKIDSIHKNEVDSSQNHTKVEIRIEKGVNLSEYTEAINGNSVAQNHVGSMYFYGLGVNKNYKTAVKWYKKSADKGNPLGQFNLGNCYFYGLGVKKDQVESVILFRKAANQGNAQAQLLLGQCYYNGYGIKKDVNMAIYWLKKASDQGEKEATLILHDIQTIKEQKQHSVPPLDANQLYLEAQKYYQDRYVSDNLLKAINLYKEAAKLGHQKSLLDLGRFYFNGTGVKRDYKEAFRLFSSDYLKNNSQAQVCLAQCYYYGYGTVQNTEKALNYCLKAVNQGNEVANRLLKKIRKEKEQNQKRYDNSYAKQIYLRGEQYYNNNSTGHLQKAIECYQKAANLGLPIAQIKLGDCYYDGKGLIQNYEKAFEWYQLAANQGNPEAQNNIGYCYYSGKGVEKNIKLAIKWYRCAAEQGFAKAQNNLANRYYNGDGFAPNYCEAVKWYKEASEQGFADASDSLGDCYYNGQGIGKDYDKAINLYRVAAQKGIARSQYKLACHYLNGLRGDIDKESAKWWLSKAAAQGYIKAQRKLDKLNQEEFTYTVHESSTDSPFSMQNKKKEQAKNNETTSKKKKSGCFITTAVCNSFSKSDDCYELTQFRWFRDHWLAKQSDGTALIREYYTIAPEIVSQINLKKKSKLIYQWIWNTYLKSCLKMIEKRQYSSCKKMYIKMVKELEKKYL